MNKKIHSLKKQNNHQKFNSGESILLTWYKLLHIVKLHNDTNALVVKAASEFIQSLVRFSEKNSQIKIEAARGRFYIQKKKMLHRGETISIVQSLMDFFEIIGVSGFQFSGKFSDYMIHEVVAFSRLLNQAEKKENPFYWISFSLEDMRLGWVTIINTREDKTGCDVEETRQKARRIYSYAYNSINDVTQKIASGKRVGIGKSVRIVQNLADMVINDDPVLLGLSTIKDYDNYTYTHSVNVAILSMCLGQKIGLSKKSLVRLGICGLFHDLGKVDIDIGIINKPGKLTDIEFSEVQKHSLNSVRQILKLQAFRDMKAQIILPPFEHHLKYDLSGYPKVNWSNPISLFGRILSIADVYDALSSARVYRPDAISQDRALGIMLEGSGKDFDPILLKWFINMIGIYPIGTLLELDTGEMGLVMKHHAEGDPAKPGIVLLISDTNGGYVKGKEVELSEQDPVTGDYRRTPIQSHNPARKGIQPAEILL